MVKVRQAKILGIAEEALVCADVYGDATFGTLMVVCRQMRFSFFDVKPEGCFSREDLEAIMVIETLSE